MQPSHFYRRCVLYTTMGKILRYGCDLAYLQTSLCLCPCGGDVPPHIVCPVQEVAAALQGSRVLTNLLKSWLQRQPLLPGIFKDDVQGIQPSTAAKAVTHLLAYIQNGPLAPGVGLSDDIAYFGMSCNEDIIRQMWHMVDAERCCRHPRRLQPHPICQVCK